MSGRDSNSTQVGKRLGPLGVEAKCPVGDTRPGHSLAPELLERALWRLTVIATVFGSMMLISVTFNAIVHYASGAMPLPPSTVVVRVLAVLASTVMVAVARFGPWPARIKLHVGLAFEIVAAGCIAFMEPDMLRAFDLPIGTISSVSLWILLFHLIVPVRPWPALAGALGAAAMVPLAIWGVNRTGVAEIPALVAAGLYKTTFGTALVAWIAARYIYRLGAEVTEARRLGSYHLDRLLGQGGMGEVWLASHALLKRPAAIKLIQPAVLGATDTESRDVALKRFEQEALSTARLQSPHTVNLYDFGTTNDGNFYYVMELLHGLDLGTLVEQYGPLPADRVAGVIKQICFSLQEAHELGLIHRDIKPANVFLCCLGPHCDFVKVLDFGLVKQTEPLAEADPQLTREGMTTGTPAYMPPEMALGEKIIDARADLYQVGCVAYWLLTGELVFERSTAMAMLAAHIHDTPDPVSQRTELEVPEALESLIMDCLAKNPGDRPASAAALLQRLEEADVHAGWTPRRAEQWWSVHRPEDRAGGPPTTDA